MAKGSVNGPDEQEVYSLLKTHIPGKVPHNFFKYLVGRDGRAIHRYEKKQDPNSFAADIEKLLAE